MNDFVDMPPMWRPQPQPPAPRRHWYRWLVIGGAALALLLTLGIGVLLGSAISSAQAAGSSQGGPAGFFQTLASTPGAQRAPSAPGAQGQCDALTVSSVSGQTIVAKAADSSTVTIHTTSSTQYTRNDQATTASAVTVGARIHVQGTHNSDGSITATSIDVG